MRTSQTIKYVRVEDNKIIIVPKAEGIEHVKKAIKSNFYELNFVEGIEKIGGQDIFAFIITLTSDIRYWSQSNNMNANKLDLYFYTYKEEKTYIHLPIFVEDNIVAK